MDSCVCQIHITYIWVPFHHNCIIVHCLRKLHPLISLLSAASALYPNWCMSVPWPLTPSDIRYQKPGAMGRILCLWLVHPDYPGLWLVTPRGHEGQTSPQVSWTKNQWTPEMNQQKYQVNREKIKIFDIYQYQQSKSNNFKLLPIVYINLHQRRPVDYDPKLDNWLEINQSLIIDLVRPWAWQFILDEGWPWAWQSTLVNIFDTKE